MSGLKLKGANGSEEVAVYVLSVKSFTERHASINAQAADLGLDIEYIWDFDVPELRKKDFQKCNTDILPPESISLVLKHFEAHRRLAQSSVNTALILEDDAIFFKGFKKGLEKYIALSNQMPDPHLILLGGADNRMPEKFLNAANESCKQENDLIEHPISTAEAYLTSKRTAKMRIDWLMKNKIELPADHLFQHIDPQLGIKHFWPPAPLATQGSITGQFKSTLDASRKSKPASFLILKYGYNRFRRQIVPRLLTSIRAQCRK